MILENQVFLVLKKNSSPKFPGNGMPDMEQFEGMDFNGEEFDPSNFKDRKDRPSRSSDSTTTETAETSATETEDTQTTAEQ